MRPLTDNRPKPLLEVGGRSMLDRTLDHLAGAGIPRAVVNLHYLGAMIRAHLAGHRAPEIVFSDETDLLLETGGGVARALPLLGPDPFVTINSDAIWHGTNPVAALLAGWTPAKAKALRSKEIDFTEVLLAFFDESRQGIPLTLEHIFFDIS
ncbi:MAG: NTP transferase domain-containing protein, partial [Pseudomonadota bacterium]